MPHNQHVASPFASILRAFAANAKPLLVETPTPDLVFRVYESRSASEPVAEFYTREAAETFMRLAEFGPGAYLVMPLSEAGR